MRPRWPSAERVLGFGPSLSLFLSSGTVVGLVEFGNLGLGAPERSIKFSGAEISSGGCADWRLRSPGKDIFVPLLVGGLVGIAGNEGEKAAINLRRFECFHGVPCKVQ